MEGLNIPEDFFESLLSAVQNVVLSLDNINNSLKNMEDTTNARLKIIAGEIDSLRLATGDNQEIARAIDKLREAIDKEENQRKKQKK